MILCAPEDTKVKLCSPHDRLFTGTLKLSTNPLRGWSVVLWLYWLWWKQQQIKHFNVVLHVLGWYFDNETTSNDRPTMYNIWSFNDLVNVLKR